MRRSFLLALSASLALTAGCKPRKDAGAELKGTTDTIRPETIAKDKDIPDDGIWMFHYGERRFLEDLYQDRVETDGKGAILPAEWKNIPSTGATYPPNRRGLYVSQHPIYNERYAADHLFQAGNATSGMMVVRVKKSCFAPEHMSGNIFDAQASISFEHQRLKSFLASDSYWSRQGGFDAFFQVCTNAYLGHSLANGYKENTCNQAVARYYDASKVQLVYDHEWIESGFWLIRDPSCISRVVSTPASLIDVLGKTYDLWDDAPFASGKAAEASKTTPLSPTVAIFATLMQAMSRASANDFTAEALYRLASMAQAGKVRYSSQYKAIFDKAFACHRDGNWGSISQIAETFVNGLPGPAGAAAEGRFAQLVQTLAASAASTTCEPQPDDATTAMQAAVKADLDAWAQKRPKPLPPVDPKILAAQARKARLAELAQKLQQVQADITNADQQSRAAYNQYSQAHNRTSRLIDSHNNLVKQYNAGYDVSRYELNASNRACDDSEAERDRYQSTWKQWEASAKSYREQQSRLNQEYQQLARQR